MTIEDKLSLLQKNALESGDFAELEDFFQTPEYKALPYIVRNDGFISSHKLKDFKRCAFCYGKKYVEKMPSRLADIDDKDALVVGQAFDDYVTEGPDTFAEMYEAVARRTGKSEKKELTKGMMAMVEQLAEEFKQNSLFASSYQKKIMFTKIGGLILKIEMDGFDEKAGIIRDVKTCRDIVKFDPKDYVFQASFYHFVVEEVTGLKCDVVLDVVDKHEGFSRSACFQYDRRTLEAERGNIIQTLDEISEAMNTNFWMPANNQKDLWSCPYYGIEGHGRPKTPFTY